MSKIIKILYLVTQSEFGGAQRYIFDLVTNLSANNYQIEVAAGGNEELFFQLKEKNIKTYQLKNLVREINPVKDLLAYFEIKKFLKEIKPDILHLNSSKAGVIGAVAGKHCNIKKIIYTVHGFVFEEPLPIWKKLFYYWAEKFSAQYKDTLICVSEFDHQIGIQKKIAPEKKLITINNGISEINFLSKEMAKQKLFTSNQQLVTSNQPLVGTIAHFYPTKGLIYLVQAAKIVIERLPETTFAIIGDGQQRKLLQTKIKKLHLAKNFLLLGAKNQAWQYLPAFDIYVCCSVKEGFPFSILEAMAAGLPIVSTKVGGISEMIQNEKTGLLVEPAKPQNLAEAIIKILKNKNLAEKIGYQAQIEVKQKFSLTKMITETEKIYQL